MISEKSQGTRYEHPGMNARFNHIVKVNCKHIEQDVVKIYSYSTSSIFVLKLTIAQEYFSLLDLWTSQWLYANVVDFFIHY